MFNINSLTKTFFIIIFVTIIIISTFSIPFLNNVTITNPTNAETNFTQIISSKNICWPLPGYTRISSPFGYRNLPTAGATTFHGGIDLPAAAGTNIISAISGKVTRTGFMGSGGCSVVVENEQYTIILHHISPNYLVQPGQCVNQGQIIAQVGPKNVYGFSNNPYKDSNRQSHKWSNNRISFTFYCKSQFKIY